MLIAFDKIRSRRIHARDGDIGSVDDLFFDDSTWDSRYFVIDAGTWLTGRKVLLVPEMIQGPLTEKDAIPVKLTQEQVRHSPDVDTAMPVSRRHQIALHSYYGWPSYWGGMFPMGPGLAGDAPLALPIRPIEEDLVGSAKKGDIDRRTQEGSDEEWDPHLRSVREIDGYAAHANDGDIGHVKDLVIDDAGWQVRYVIVKTGGWLRGIHVLLASSWLRDVSWRESSVHVDLTRDEISDSPPLDVSHPITRQYEEELFRHYSRSRYWI
jgi:hypothetical protein